MSSLLKIAKNIVSHTPTKLSVKGGCSTQNSVISAFAEDLGSFLRSNKRKHISIEDLNSFYKERFPQINLRINNNSPMSVSSSFLGITPKASSGVKLKDDLSGVEEFVLDLQSSSPLDKIKKILHIPNKKKDFYVNASFADSLVHESTHVLQSYMKPTQLSYQKSLRNWAGKRWEHPSWKSGLNFDGNWAYTKKVYAEEIGFFNPYKFRAQLMKTLRASYYTDESLVSVNVKNCIREAQAEKQAYTMGNRQKLEFKYPRLAQTRFGSKLFDKLAAKRANSGWKWDEKIDAMKEEYFQIIAAERAKHAASLKLNA